ncbi:MAG: hypothetical protein A2V66_10020 [Ignavibacteria bacterium RBG_13_36_8]|nr:MAG: hypothetical protein A2V66_10020 [Ignavibacteria bacterium RBG_13_36_8]
MKRIVFSMIFIGLFSTLFWYCTSIEPVETARLSVQLTDAPNTYDAVNISFTEIAVKVDSIWAVFMQVPTTINLLDYRNGNTLQLGEMDVLVGHVNQIRLKIDSATIVVDGVTHPLEVPSGSTSGLKFNTHFVLEAGQTMELVIDFDLGKSISTTGPPNNPHSYKLHPVIRVVDISQTGSIIGTVTNPEANPLAFAIQSNDTVTTSIVNVATGEFELSFLPESGSYKVVIVDEEDKTFQQNGVNVTGGQSTDLGSITLQ